ncbi:SDR family NAD(P)-dependent oxidoreductase [Acidocella aminolytica]|uniref:Oxidoreductase/short-chain dehydrogenase/reductase SDR n=1 Tax=Acidocella aminolytica 101 = DSM 11237 TaxID=1120923 RepID=A0A0D6PGK8_9PROT|nr:SDR family oxidoreductase [Acidocella aminolytica]GAN80333.1 oxidoreductase/short-chain dehydrogenase/reductase SDR [Acidocella aminolytica 101 = DSM 11237]GBQ42990.1 dehydrogenase [Acidocella aminolytica 101 = DSM 11237]SHE30036.1 3-oxoacyl-[acyl-carrier protein] reductase [Acidocella aminolytica 101 = DSM 11237]
MSEVKTIVVTGAASGIGRAASRKFLAAGHKVIGLDINTGEDAVVPLIAVDLRDEASVKAAVAEVVEQLGHIDILVNCAGTDGEAPLPELDINDFDRIFGVNIRGMFLMTRETIRHIPKGGRIINVASELGFLGRAQMSCYCATKGAVIAATRAWAREFAPGIQVNAVAPGPTNTPLLHFDAIPESLRQEEMSNPMKRIGEPEEVAAAIIFLASPEATFITGQCINVDGGSAMH